MRGPKLNHSLRFHAKEKEQQSHRASPSTSFWQQREPLRRTRKQRHALAWLHDQLHSLIASHSQPPLRYGLSVTSYLQRDPRPSGEHRHSRSASLPLNATISRDNGQPNAAGDAYARVNLIRRCLASLDSCCGRSVVR